MEPCQTDTSGPSDGHKVYGCLGGRRLDALSASALATGLTALRLCILMRASFSFLTKLSLANSQASESILRKPCRCCNLHYLLGWCNACYLQGHIGSQHMLLLEVCSSYICIQLAHKAAEVVMLEKFWQQVPSKLCWLPHNKTAAQPKRQTVSLWQCRCTCRSCKLACFRQMPRRQRNRKTSRRRCHICNDLRVKTLQSGCFQTNSTSSRFAKKRCRRSHHVSLGESGHAAQQAAELDNCSIFKYTIFVR